MPTSYLPSGQAGRRTGGSWLVRRFYRSSAGGISDGGVELLFQIVDRLAQIGAYHFALFRSAYYRGYRGPNLAPRQTAVAEAGRPVGSPVRASRRAIAALSSK